LAATVESVAELERLRAGHAAAVLEFERANRAWFTRTISDRGDAYFEDFDDRFADLLEDQELEGGAYYVLVESDGSVAGRFNLIFRGDGVAELGYRVAEDASGRGTATAVVTDLCRVAADRHGLHAIVAATSSDNRASQRVLEKAGFVDTGPAGPEDLGGRTGTWYRLDLTGSSAPERQD